MKKLMVNCPSCEKKFEYYTSKYRPFCCEKCKMIDLGHWFNEEYNIAGKSSLPTNLEELSDEMLEELAEKLNAENEDDFDGEVH